MLVLNQIIRYGLLYRLKEFFVLIHFLIQSYPGNLKIQGKKTLKGKKKGGSLVSGDM